MSGTIRSLSYLTFTTYLSMTCARQTLAQPCEAHWIEKFHNGQLSGNSQAVMSFAVFDDDDDGPRPTALYAAGYFGGTSESIARWDGQQWSALDHGPCCYTAWGLAVFDDDADGPHPNELYATGGFQYTYDIDVWGIAKWDGMQWSSVGGGIVFGDSGVREPTVFDEDGPGGQPPALFVTGEFSEAGGVPANNIARWNGVAWTPLGSGLEGVGNVLGTAQAVFDDDDAGPHAPALYVGGYFSTAGGVTVNNIARWDGAAWTSLGLGANDYVAALMVFDDDGPGPHAPALYAGGLFTMVGDVAANRIAKWDGRSWSAVGTGFNEAVYDLKVFDPDGPGPQSSRLIAGGIFTGADGNPANRIATWDGSSWTPIGTGMDGTVYRFTEYDVDGAGPLSPRLFVGGIINSPDGNPSKSIYYWTGAQWRGLGSAPNSWIRSLATFDDDGDGPHPRELIAGGHYLTSAGGLLTRNIAKWNGSDWAPLGLGPSSTIGGEVSALALFDTDGPGPQGESLLAGGSFDSGGTIGKNITAWDGDTWSGLNGGTIGHVYALAVFDDDGPGTNAPALIAGGNISIAGGIPVNKLARWDGTTWSSVGAGVDNTVRALTVFDDDGPGANPPALFIGGSFTHANGIEANAIVKWDGITWMPLGTGLMHTGSPATVYALAVFDDDGPGPQHPVLYVGGQFSFAGDIPALRIARWDGSTWSSAGTMTGSYLQIVRTLFTCDLDGAGPGRELLYVGGGFNSTGEILANNVAAWDGARWLPLGLGTTNGPPLLELEQRTVYGEAHAFAEYDTDGDGPIPPSLFVGGDFKYAGGLPSPYIAEWGIGAPLETPTITHQPASPSLCAGGSVSLLASAVGDGSLSYQWRKNGVNLREGPNLLGVNSNTLVFLHTTAADSGQYECVIVLDECGGIVSNSSSLTVFMSGSGDGNTDGNLNGRDVDAMASALVTLSPVTAGLCALDVTANGILDINDLEPFVAKLLE
jgi:Immunoglobulin domain